MVLDIEIDGDVAILSSIGRLMNDPRYTSAGRDVEQLLTRGVKNYIVELADVREPGAPLLGVLMTVTREIRHAGGEVVLARPSRGMDRYLDAMKLEDYWEVFDSVNDAKAFFNTTREKE